MDEFLRQNYFLITHAVEILAAVTGLYYYRKFKPTTAKYFIYFLVYAFCVDFLGRYPKYLQLSNNFQLIEGTLIEMNYWWYAIFWIIAFPSFVYFINVRVLKNSTFIQISKYCIYLFFASIILYLMYDMNSIFKTTNIFLSVLSGLMIVLQSSIYFLEVLRTDKIFAFYKSIYFYINASAFVWSLIITPLVFYNLYFSTADWNFVLLKWQIFLYANAFMYLTFTFALIFCKPEYD